MTKKPALRPIVHRTLTVERTYAAAPARVFAAWVDPEVKARWFIGPPAEWKVLERRLDLRVGGHELLVGQLTGSATETRYEARYHVIVPDQRLVYVYDMQHAGGHLSTSLATVDFERTAAGGTRMVLTEQAAFHDGEDGAPGRQQGIAAHFELIAPLVEDPATIVSSRVFAAPRERVYAAFRGPFESKKTFFHGHTYTGNPLACAAALANLELFDREQTLAHLAALEPTLERGLGAIAALPHVGEIRRRGVMIGIELVQDRATRGEYDYAARMGHRVTLAARARGVVVRPLGNVVVLMPPLAITEAELVLLFHAALDLLRQQRVQRVRRLRDLGGSFCVHLSRRKKAGKALVFRRELRRSLVFTATGAHALRREGVR